MTEKIIIAFIAGFFAAEILKKTGALGGYRYASNCPGTDTPAPLKYGDTGFADTRKMARMAI